MGLRTIVEKGDAVLTKTSRPVTDFGQRTQVLLDDLVETMKANMGVGLAAPQVGVLRRVVVIEVDGKVYELVNPEIVETEGEQFEEEGCLSIPGLVGTVRRPAYVKVRAFDRNGNTVEYEGTELLARAFCHEIDHLDGILFDSKAKDLYYPELEDDEEEVDG